jgi:hypothetical protein
MRKPPALIRRPGQHAPAAARPADPAEQQAASSPAPQLTRRPVAAAAAAAAAASPPAPRPSAAQQLQSLLAAARLVDRQQHAGADGDRAAALSAIARLFAAAGPQG